MSNAKKFVDTVNSLFPGLEMTHLRYGDSKCKDIWQHYEFNIPPANKNLVNSPYFYEGKTAVHFSSIQALSSILTEKSLRLYNLHALNDPREFTFASKIFRLEKKFFDDAKNNLFLTSFCERAILKRPADEFNMWRLYGHQGKGVAIVFKLANNPEKWEDFHFSKVSYGDEKRGNFKKLMVLMDEINKTKPTINGDFGKLCAFHKSNLFKHEYEVRLLFDKRELRTGEGGRTVTKDNNPIFPNIKHDIFKLIENKENVRYIQIPIYNTSINSKPTDIPLLKIDQIILGYNYSEDASNIIKHLQTLCLETIGYNPVIKQTRLRNFYWDIKTST